MLIVVMLIKKKRCNEWLKDVLLEENRNVNAEDSVLHFVNIQQN